jgi:hypothetical protein
MSIAGTIAAATVGALGSVAAVATGKAYLFVVISFFIFCIFSFFYLLFILLTCIPFYIFPFNILSLFVSCSLSS